MSVGAVVIAKNTNGIDYVKLARWNAKNISRHLNVPVTLITDEPDDYPEFDNVLAAPSDSEHRSRRQFADVPDLVVWRNSGRHAVYSLSPYDTTLLLDVDYVVASDVLKQVLESRPNLSCYRYAYDVAGLLPHNEMNFFGSLNMPMYWATVICFTKSQYAESVFRMMEMIEVNYEMYATLYKFSHRPYRNDYALSIALNTLNGHFLSAVGSIPGKIATVTHTSLVEQVGEDCYKVQYDKKNKRHELILRDMDIHVMGKTYLEDIIDRS